MNFFPAPAAGSNALRNGKSIKYFRHITFLKLQRVRRIDFYIKFEVPIPLFGEKDCYHYRRSLRDRTGKLRKIPAKWSQCGHGGY